jgi:drug/metabolite transporter (DMT)-like permease
MVAFFIFLQPLLAASLDRFVIGTPWDGRVGISALLITAGVVLALAPGRRPGPASGRGLPQALDHEGAR